MSARILTRDNLYTGFSCFSVVTLELHGGRVIQRELEDHGDGVVVLPYDPQRRVALLVEQLRVGLICRGEKPYHVEMPGGILDGPDPEAWAKREALEECGVNLRRLEPVARAWTMATVSTERVWMYLAPYSISDRINPGGGNKDEGEDINVLEISLKQLESDIATGRMNDLKTITLAFALKLRQPELFD